jgi:hypothetical protein
VAQIRQIDLNNVKKLVTTALANKWDLPHAMVIALRPFREGGESEEFLKQEE